jgi:predicted AlkP superfamily phosphohydrolase/phosphomutase
MSAKRRVLVIGLDGFELSLAERLMAEGAMPNMARLRDDSARCPLDHGRDKFSGLSWEHVCSGRSPSDGGRWAAVTFDPENYTALQEPTSVRPFLADLPARSVVFDVPYCDLTQAPEVLGLTDWGAHDPGVSAVSRPEGLREEIHRRFGPYPAAQWIYGFSWPSAARTRVLGDALVRAANVRSHAACWLLSERLPDWELAIVVSGECHSAIEPLWHGLDPSHPLHNIESAQVAAEALRNVYIAVDAMIGDLRRHFPDATVVLFSMHGMGANQSDIPSMLLLPELLYRYAFGKPYMRERRWAGHTAAGVPLLAENEIWESVMEEVVPTASGESAALRLLRKIGLASKRTAQPDETDYQRMTWMPAARYQPFWSRMPAFALPAFYDGRVRINLAGREARGLVPRDRYAKICAELTEQLQGSRNILTGESAVEEIFRSNEDPDAIGPTEADLYIVWRSFPLGLTTPALGSVGPVPCRRMGGHTGRYGFVYVADRAIAPGEARPASSFDVVPTVIDLLGGPRLPDISGTSLLPTFRARQAELTASGR